MREEILTGLIIGLSMIILGLLVRRFKINWAISVYNTLSKDNKKNVQIHKIRLLFWNFFVLVGFILCTHGAISHFTEIKFIHPIVIAFIVILFMFFNYQIGKYDKNKKGGMISIYRLIHR